MSYGRQHLLPGLSRACVALLALVFCCSIYRLPRANCFLSCMPLHAFCICFVFLIS
jgi:hypothetical protein